MIIHDYPDTLIFAGPGRDGGIAAYGTLSSPKVCTFKEYYEHSESLNFAGPRRDFRDAGMKHLVWNFDPSESSGLRNDIALFQGLRCIPERRDLQKSAHCGMRILEHSHSATVLIPRPFRRYVGDAGMMHWMWNWGSTCGPKVRTIKECYDYYPESLKSDFRWGRD